MLMPDLTNDCVAIWPQITTATFQNLVESLLKSVEVFTIAKRGTTVIIAMVLEYCMLFKKHIWVRWSVVVILSAV